MVHSLIQLTNNYQVPNNGLGTWRAVESKRKNMLVLILPRAYTLA